MTSLGLIVPPHRRTWYGPGEQPRAVTPGSILLVDHGNDVSTAIRWGQRVESLTNRAIRGFTWNDHAALVIDGDVVSEMGVRGHELRPLAHYDDRVECVVELLIDDESRVRGLAYDQSCHDVEYGFVQYPFFVADAFGLKFMGGWGATMICSTHVTMCAMGMGLFPTLPPSGVLPAHLSAWFGATSAAAMRYSGGG